MEVVIAYAATAVLSSTVTLVAYACCVATGNADRMEEDSRFHVLILRYKEKLPRDFPRGSLCAPERLAPWLSMLSCSSIVILLVSVFG